MSMRLGSKRCEPIRMRTRSTPPANRLRRKKPSSNRPLPLSEPKSTGSGPARSRRSVTVSPSMAPVFTVSKWKSARSDPIVVSGTPASEGRGAPVMRMSRMIRRSGSTAMTLRVTAVTSSPLR
jgi:hypothetical protein